MRCMLGWWFNFILSWLSNGALLESFSRAHTFWYYRDSLMELSQMHRLPYHHFNGVHVRSLIHPHWVILKLSRQTKCTSYYTGAYFPLLAVEMIVFSQTCYSLHYMVKGYLFALLVIVLVIFAKISLRRSTTFRFWLFHYLWILSRLLCWDRGSYPNELFSWDSIGSFIWDDDGFPQ